MIQDALKKTIAEALVAAGVSQEAGAIKVVLEHPGDISHGDYSTSVALMYSKELKQPPRAVAEKVVAHIGEILADAGKKAGAGLDDVVSIDIAGPGFVNFHLAKRFFNESVSDIIRAGENFGKGKILAGQTWAVEYASPNPNKAMHLGHMRNAITGVAFNNLLEANGAKVIREMLDNNRGIAIAKLMWGYLVAARKDGKRVEDISYWGGHKEEWHTPESAGKKPDRFADEFYVKGSAECENPESDQKVRGLVVAWESKDEHVWDLWQTVLGFAHAGQAQTLERLGARFDHVWHESDFYEKGKAYVQKGLAAGVFKKLEDGAILTNFEAAGYKLAETIVEKKDGTSLYITQDIALNELKKQKYGADHLVWVIGPEQSLALQQVFTVCEQLGIGKRDEFMHLPYGYVTIKGEGKMSSRAGNVVYVDDLLDEVKAKVADIVKDRPANAEMPQGEIESVSESIAHAVIVFEMLKMGRMKDSAFDFKTALSFEGDSGPYLQYAVTRADSILRKAADAGISSAFLAAALPADMPITTLEKIIYRYPEVVERAGQTYEPHHIVTYLIELSAAFNNFYANATIVDEKDPAAPYRVALTEAFAIVMKNGLDLLGIRVPEKM